MTIRTAAGIAAATARIDPQLEKGTVAGEFGWWQPCDDLGMPGAPVVGPGSSNLNGLMTVAAADPVSGAPNFRAVPCEVSRVADAPERWEGSRPLSVRAVGREAGEVTVLDIAREDGAALPPFRPGQFVTLAAEPGGVARSYSLIGAAEPHPLRYRLAVRRSADGALSPRLATLAAGGMLHATVPLGRFTLPLRHDRPVVAIAFGVGITPFLSMLETMARAGNGPEVLLCHAAASPRDQPFRDRLLALEAALPFLTLRCFFSRPDGARFSVAALPQRLFDARARFYLCGGPAAVDAATADLLARRVPRFEIFSERFRAAPRPDASQGAAARRVTLARSGLVLDWQPGGFSLLDAAAARGVALPAGCRTGQCESCAVTVLEGRVSHGAGSIAEDDGLCLTCCATPETDLVLDA